ncbi:MAG: zf-HC2 domain-containing protein [Longimicrobiales bacterium]
MSEHERWTHRLTEYVDGDLSPTDREAFERHADGCAACREAVEEIRTVVAAARAMGPVEPPRDLWPGIERVVSRRLPGAVERSVIRLPTAPRRVPEPVAPSGRRLLSTPQLAAAAVLLVMASVAGTLALGPGLAAPDDGVPVAPSAVRAVSTGDGSAPGANPELAQDVADLEAALSEARDRLDPNTVRILEKNLAVIERAIVESRQALALDPENEYLRQHLDRAVERKRDYLEEATSIAAWSS